MASLSGSTSETFLSEVEGVRIEMRDQFSKSHQMLHAREAVLLSELDQLVASYKGEGIKEQIRELNLIKESMKSKVQRNENLETVVKGVAVMDDRIRELEESFETTQRRMSHVELEWDRELEGRLKEMGGIGIIEQIDHKKKEEPVMKAFKHGHHQSNVSSIAEKEIINTKAPSKSQRSHSLNLIWQCAFCTKQFQSEQEKDIHMTACSFKEYIHIERFRDSRGHPSLQPPAHSSGQKGEHKMTGQSYLRSQSLDTSLQDQPVTLIWKKQHMTIETKITYFDNLNGAIQLNWDKLNNLFTSSAYLTPGNHNGCLTLSDSSYNGETGPFYVLEKSDAVQEFTLSLVNIPNPADGKMKSSSSKVPKEGDAMKSMKSRLKDSEERVKSLEQKCNHLFRENEKLKKDNDKSKNGKCKNPQHENLMLTVNRLDEEKERLTADKNIALIERSRFKKELNDLKEQLIKSKPKGNIEPIDFNNLKESDLTVFWDQFDSTELIKDKTPNSYFNTDEVRKIQELKKELSGLKNECGQKEKEAIEAKVRSEKIIEYLHGEKTRLESELKEAREALSKMKIEIYEIKNPLPLPSSSSALSQPQRASRQDSVYGPFFITTENKCEILVLPLSYLDPKRYEKSLVYCKPTPDSLYHCSGMLHCTFQDSKLKKSISGISFFKEVGTCDGEYDGVRHITTEPKKAVFLFSNLVLVQVKLPQDS